MFYKDNIKKVLTLAVNDMRYDNTQNFNLFYSMLNVHPQSKYLLEHTYVTMIFRSTYIL